MDDIIADLSDIPKSLYVFPSRGDYYCPPNISKKCGLRLKIGLPEA